uniref:C-type lectin domain-containing protein n=1 Tax=Amphiprion percula TaxID=161767 RepID=A0A3P8SN06_AMPPE
MWDFLTFIYCISQHDIIIILSPHNSTCVLKFICEILRCYVMFDGCPCTGGVGLCSDVIREYYVIITAMNWTDAQSYCRKKYTDLATVGNSENMMTLVSTATASGASREMWIGLRETGSASWLWSVGESENSSGVVEYTNWAKTGSASISSTCGAMRSDGKWLSSSCTTTRPFVCQSERRHKTEDVEMHMSGRNCAFYKTLLSFV